MSKAYQNDVKNVSKSILKYNKIFEYSIKSSKIENYEWKLSRLIINKI